ncbi:MAG: TIGR03790 family protein [Phycisphaeraceae bacterium]|nr:TIGR03790 family protein [Phycisphaeraceae bacterium]
MTRRVTGFAVALMLLAGTSHAGGTPENALLVIDPLSPDSLHVGNYYWHARGFAPNSILYLDPDATNYPTWVQTVQPGFLGELTQRAIRPHTQFVIVTPGNNFFVNAPGLLSDMCAPVNRFSMSGLFTIAQNSAEVLTGTLASTATNQYFGTTIAGRYFDSQTKYVFGNPSTNAAARSYFIGCMLGYTGARGNTVEEILAMIDRSVAADGTRPTGTFYFMNNTGDSARNVRASSYSPVISAMPGYGYGATQINGLLPSGRHDCLGIMTGFASADIGGADLTLVPGSFADHLTSYAATFDNASQTKMSEWIRKGASGTSGAIEEPCNYTGKFPHPRFHAVYAQGLSLGEAFLRSHAGTPFQTLFVGDPLTRAFTHIPVVDIPDAPAGPVSGTLILTPVSSTTAPGASISMHEIYINGVKAATSAPSTPFTIDTTTLADGWHDVRVLAYDSTLIRSIGRWVGSMIVDNAGRSVSLSSTPDSGSLTTAFRFDSDAIGADAVSIDLYQQGRIVGTRVGEGPIEVAGRVLGSGPVTLWAVATFDDGTTASSEPLEIQVSTTAPDVTHETPAAYSYTRFVDPSAPFVLELPATYTNALSTAAYTITTPPALATITGGSGASRVLTPLPGACGYDQMAFQVSTPSGTSNQAIVTIIYRNPVACAADLNYDCTSDILDLLMFLDAFGICNGSPGPCGTGGINADFNNDLFVDILDFLDFIDAFGTGCS